METLSKIRGRPRKEKPYAIVRSKNETIEFSAPKSLLHLSLRTISDYILNVLDDVDKFELFKSSGNVRTLPIMMLDMLEEHLMREVKLIGRKVDERCLKIWQIFFCVENPTRRQRHLNLEEFLNPDSCSGQVFEQLTSDQISQSLKIIDLTLSSNAGFCKAEDSDRNFEENEEEWKDKFEKLLRKSPEIESIHLKGKFFDDDCLHLVAKFASKKLKVLRLSNAGAAFNDIGRLTDEGFVDFVDQILSNSNTSFQLYVFDMGHWHACSSQITAKAIVYLSNKLKSLSEIHFRISHLSFSEFVVERYREVIESGNKITSVYLYNDQTVFEDEYCKDTKDALNIYLEQFFPKITSLHLRSFRESLKKDCQVMLSTLGDQIKSCDLILAKDLDLWAKTAKNLESLTISDPKLGLKWKSIALNHLRRFCFDDSSAFINFDFIVQVMFQARSLQSLIIEASRICDATDDKLSSALARSPQLASNLTELSLSAYQEKINLTEISIQLLLTNLKNLVKITNISYWNISTKSLHSILIEHPNVQIVNAVFLPNRVIPLE